MPVSIRTRPDQPPAATQSLGRRLTDAALALIATGALFTALAPLSSLLLHLTAWAVFILVLVISAWMDRARSANEAPGEHLPTTNSVTSPETLERRYPGASFPSSLGAFNTQDGLDLNVSPESTPLLISLDHGSISSHCDDPWEGPDFDTFTSFPTSDPFESIHH